MRLLLLVYLASALPILNAYNILAVFPVCVHSHYTLGFRLVQALLKKDHNVTIISCLTQPKSIKNLHEISLKEDLSELFDNIGKEFAQTSTYYYFNLISWLLDWRSQISLAIIKNKEINKLIHSNATFDVVILENVNLDFLGILRHIFKCPLIVQAPYTMEMFNRHFIENPFSPAYVPNNLIAYDSNMNFWERLHNTYRQIILEILRQFKQIPFQRQLIKDFFPEAPDLYEDIYNVSLYFVSSNPSLNDPMPLQRNVKEIGGHHVPPPQKLPEDIESFINNAKDGIILFSMGSFVNSSAFQGSKKTAIMRTFLKIKQKVIWSINDDSIVSTNNVLIRKWLPQNDILAHPKTMLFISHGGLLGTYEAIYNGVPILGLPVAWDQMKNIEDAARKGFAIRLNLADFTEQAFENALQKLINDIKYKRIAKQRSKIMRDSLLTPLEEAVYWVEYVIRHKGAQHLRPTVTDLKWYQRYLIDILMFLTTIFILIVYTVYLFIKIVIAFRSKIKQD